MELPGIKDLALKTTKGKQEHNTTSFLQRGRQKYFSVAIDVFLRGFQAKLRISFYRLASS
jgi:hypothetical protein